MSHTRGLVGFVLFLLESFVRVLRFAQEAIDMSCVQLTYGYLNRLHLLICNSEPSFQESVRRSLVTDIPSRQSVPRIRTLHVCDVNETFQHSFPHLNNKCLMILDVMPILPS